MTKKNLPLDLISNKKPRQICIQLNYRIKNSITQYYSLVQEKKWVFPDFSDFCPICGGKDCAVRIGFYYRRFFDIQLNVYITDLPVARYKCRRKGKCRLKDLTFSLLPNCLIPYFSPTIPALMDIINNKLIDKSTENLILDKLYSHIYTNSFNLSERSLLRYYKLFFQTAVKIKLAWKKNIFKPPPRSNYYSHDQIAQYILNFPCKNNDNPAVVMSDHYYEKHGQYFNNAGFLFGTAYQFR